MVLQNKYKRAASVRHRSSLSSPSTECSTTLAPRERRECQDRLRTPVPFRPRGAPSGEPEGNDDGNDAKVDPVDCQRSYSKRPLRSNADRYLEEDKEKSDGEPVSGFCEGEEGEWL